ncbi:putative disease resistance protein RGA1 [Mercurialis annua]|uniref:putative disease resistance protein RGA1 n=1 Tax=Mercurialis annua TaxID=3986 RepID=UPI0024AD4327|nr:putative disease resistance protein RGA1 [Mercurialis annua]
MAESLVFEVLAKLSSLIYEEVSLLKGVRGELEKLRSNLRAIQAVLSDAENRQWKEAVVKLWLDKLKDVSYDIDDVLDEWSTAILKGEMNEKSDKRSSSQIPFRYEIADKITKINVRLDVIACGKDRYSFNQLVVNKEQLVEQRITTSVVNSTEVKRNRKL